MTGQTDQSRPVSRVSVVEALTQIRALCDTEMALADTSGERLILARVRAVLDAVPVDATPAQGIDREALVRTLTEWLEDDYPYEDDTEVDATSVSEGADRVLALVRPVEGITLSPEEAELAAEAMRRSWNTTASLEWNERREALASRLEAAHV